MAECSINSKITGNLEPDQKIKADFLKDGWYAVFNLTETMRDEKRALGYVYASRLYPPESVKAQVRAEIHKTYTLQIKAVNNMEEAKNIVETLRQKGLDAHWTSVNIHDRGIWYRIFIGKFPKREEVFKFLDEKKIKDSYPDCMVRRMSLPDTH
jgi:cell division protein FtsN